MDDLMIVKKLLMKVKNQIDDSEESKVDNEDEIICDECVFKNDDNNINRLII